MAAPAGYSANSMLPAAGGMIHAMSGGGDVPPGYQGISMLPVAHAQIHPYTGGANPAFSVAPSPAPSVAPSVAPSPAPGPAFSVAPSVAPSPAPVTSTILPVIAVGAVSATLASASPTLDGKDDGKKTITLFGKELRIGPSNHIWNLAGDDEVEALRRLGVDGAKDEKLKEEVLQALYDGTCDTDLPISMLLDCEPIRRLIQTLAVTLLGKLQPPKKAIISLVDGPAATITPETQSDTLLSMTVTDDTCTTYLTTSSATILCIRGKSNELPNYTMVSCGTIEKPGAVYRKNGLPPLNAECIAGAIKFTYQGVTIVNVLDNSNTSAALALHPDIIVGMNTVQDYASDNNVPIFYKKNDSFELNDTKIDEKSSCKPALTTIVFKNTLLAQAADTDRKAIKAAEELTLASEPLLNDSVTPSLAKKNEVPPPPELPSTPEENEVPPPPLEPHPTNVLPPTERMKEIAVAAVSVILAANATLSEGNPTANPTANPEDNPVTNPAGKPEDNPAGKPEDNPAGKPEDNPAGNPTGNPTSKETNPTFNTLKEGYVSILPLLEKITDAAESLAVNDRIRNTGAPTGQPRLWTSKIATYSNDAHTLLTNTVKLIENVNTNDFSNILNKIAPIYNRLKEDKEIESNTELLNAKYFTSVDVDEIIKTTDPLDRIRPIVDHNLRFLKAIGDMINKDQTATTKISTVASNHKFIATNFELTRNMKTIIEKATALQEILPPLPKQAIVRTPGADTYFAQQKPGASPILRTTLLAPSAPSAPSNDKISQIQTMESQLKTLLNNPVLVKTLNKQRNQAKNKIRELKTKYKINTRPVETEEMGQLSKIVMNNKAERDEILKQIDELDKKLTQLKKGVTLPTNPIPFGPATGSLVGTVPGIPAVQTQTQNANQDFAKGLSEINELLANDPSSRKPSIVNRIIKNQKKEANPQQNNVVNRTANQKGIVLNNLKKKLAHKKIGSLNNHLTNVGFDPNKPALPSTEEPSVKPVEPVKPVEEELSTGTTTASVGMQQVDKLLETIPNSENFKQDREKKQVIYPVITALNQIDQFISNNRHNHPEELRPLRVLNANLLTYLHTYLSQPGEYAKGKVFEEIQKIETTIEQITNEIALKGGKRKRRTQKKPKKSSSTTRRSKK
jgi:hypothetical protein